MVFSEVLYGKWLIIIFIIIISISIVIIIITIILLLLLLLLLLLYCCVVGVIVYHYHACTLHKLCINYMIIASFLLLFRTILAAIHFNYNLKREPKVDKQGIWSSISAKNRSLYSILDLLYFMLPYTMRHPTVLISWFNLSIVHGTFCFSHSISRI